MHDVVFGHYLTHLHETPIDQISEEMVINLYLENCKRSIAQPNKAMKILQAVILFTGIATNFMTFYQHTDGTLGRSDFVIDEEKSDIGRSGPYNSKTGQEIDQLTA